MYKYFVNGDKIWQNPELLAALNAQARLKLMVSWRWEISNGFHTLSLESFERYKICKSKTVMWCCANYNASLRVLSFGSYLPGIIFTYVRLFMKLIRTAGSQGPMRSNSTISLNLKWYQAWLWHVTCAIVQFRDEDIFKHSRSILLIFIIYF